MTTSQPVICENPVADDLVAFVDGELDRSRADLVRTHVEWCPICDAALLEQIQMVAQISTLTRKGA